MLADRMQAADQINENLLLCVWQTAARITAEKLIFIRAVRISWIPFLPRWSNAHQDLSQWLREFFTWPTRYSPITKGERAE
jgi:hypothetical protein